MLLLTVAFLHSGPRIFPLERWMCYFILNTYYSCILLGSLMLSAFWSEEWHLGHPEHKYRVHWAILVETFKFRLIGVNIWKKSKSINASLHTMNILNLVTWWSLKIQHLNNHILLKCCSYTAVLGGEKNCTHSYWNKPCVFLLSNRYGIK